MKAIKRSVEMRRQIEEAEKEIQRRKEEEQKAREKSLETVLSDGSAEKEVFDPVGENKLSRSISSINETKMEEMQENNGETIVKESLSIEEEQDLKEKTAVEEEFESKETSDTQVSSNEEERREIVLPKFLEARRVNVGKKNEDEIETTTEFETRGDHIIGVGKKLISQYAVYAVSILLVMMFSLVGAYYAISTGFTFFSGLGESKDTFIGILLIFIGILAPIAFNHVIHKITATENDSPLTWMVPDGVSFLVSLIFLFVA